MAYCTTTDVNAILGVHPATSSTTPTLTQLGLMIDDISAQMDAYLKGAGIASVPVTSSQDSTVAAFLIGVNKWGAAASFLKGMFPEATGPGENPAFAFWEKRYNNVLDGWLDKDGPKGIPANLLGGAGDANPSTYFTRNPDQEETLGDLLENMDRTRIGDRF